MKEICVKAAEESLRKVIDFINESLEMEDFSQDVRAKIRLVVEEIFVNIAMYAYEKVDEEKSPLYGKVVIACEKKDEPERVIIRFADEGIRFNPLEVGDADTSGELFMEQEGGFGIHLVKKNVDGLKYEYVDGKNVLTVVKYI